MKIDAFISPVLSNIIERLNEIHVKKEDIISVFQNKLGEYVVVFYK